MVLIVNKKNGQTHEWMLRQAEWEVKPISYEMDKGGIHILEGHKEVEFYPSAEISSFEVAR